MKEINREPFNSDIDKLNKLYDKYPELVTKETRKLVNKINSIKDIKGGKLVKELAASSDKIIMLILAFLVLLFGFANGITIVPAHLFGMIFFFAGMLAVLADNSKGFGIILLFSHGMTGLGFMLGPVLNTALSSPILTDGNPTLVYAYLGVLILLLLVGIAITIIYNLSDGLKKLPMFKLIPLYIFTALIILTDIFPKIIPMLIK